MFIQLLFTDSSRTNTGMFNSRTAHFKYKPTYSGAYLAGLAETMFEINMKKQSSDFDQQSIFLVALKKHSYHMKQLPKIISVLKKELGVDSGVSELKAV